MEYVYFYIWSIKSEHGLDEKGFIALLINQPEGTNELDQNIVILSRTVSKKRYIDVCAVVPIYIYYLETDYN